MTRTRRWFAWIAFVAALAIAAWTMRGRIEPPGTSATGIDHVDAASVESSPPSVERPPRVRPGIKEMMATGYQRAAMYDVGIDELRTRAQAGDVRAQVWFGMSLARCIGRDRDAHAAHLADDAPNAYRSDPRPPDNAHPLTAEVFRSAQEQERQLVETCVALEPDEIGQYHEWLERAARTGDIEAKVAYASLALAEFTARRPYYSQTSPTDAVIGNLEEVIRRRDLARAWAEDAVRAGDFGILLDLANAYGSGGMNGLMPRDRLRAAIYAHTATLSIAWKSPWERHGLENAWRSGPARDDSLTDAQWDEVTHHARALYVRWYGDPPDGG